MPANTVYSECPPSLDGFPLEGRVSYKARTASATAEGRDAMLRVYLKAIASALGLRLNTEMRTATN